MPSVVLCPPISAGIGLAQGNSVPYPHSNATLGAPNGVTASHAGQVGLVRNAVSNARSFPGGDALMPPMTGVGPTGATWNVPAFGAPTMRDVGSQSTNPIAIAPGC